MALDKDAEKRITPASKERVRCSILIARKWRRVTQDPRTAQERAVELLKATLATSSWLPDTEAKRLVWAIRCSLVLGVLILVASVVEKGLWDWLDLLIAPPCQR